MSPNNRHEIRCGTPESNEMRKCVSADDGDSLESDWNIYGNVDIDDIAVD